MQDIQCMSLSVWRYDKEYKDAEENHTDL